MFKKVHDVGDVHDDQANHASLLLQQNKLIIESATGVFYGS